VYAVRRHPDGVRREVERGGNIPGYCPVPDVCSEDGGSSDLN